MSASIIDELLIGDSKPMRELKRLIAQLGPTDLPVLIEGETGTGKELVAQALHAVSGRAGRIVAVNVCAIPETMFEAVLFGHVRGAFTGALHDAPGYLAEADGGTLFLDEIGSLPRLLQSKLLRAIETGEYREVGGKNDKLSRFRVVAATNECMDALLQSERFRADLAYRLMVGRLRAPALRERLEDVPPLVRHFVVAAGNGRELDASALSELCARTWPGNVRELRSTVLRALVTSTARTVSALNISPRRAPGASDSSDRPRLIGLLESMGWNVELTAHAEGVHRSTLYRRLQRFGISKRQMGTAHGNSAQSL